MIEAIDEMNTEMEPFQLTTSPFDLIRETNERGEFWSARRLMTELGYQRWERMNDAVERAMISCRNARMNPDDHFRGAAKQILFGKGATQDVHDFHLSRMGCYLTAMNADPRKEKVSRAQAYFAVSTIYMESKQTATVDLAALDRRVAELERGHATTFRTLAPSFVPSDRFKARPRRTYAAFARNLIESRGAPQRTCEVVEAMRLAGYQLNLKNIIAHATVRNTLLASPLVIMVDRGLWDLGEQPQPFAPKSQRSINPNWEHLVCFIRANYREMPNAYTIKQNVYDHVWQNFPDHPSQTLIGRAVKQLFPTQRLARLGPNPTRKTGFLNVERVQDTEKN